MTAQQGKRFIAMSILREDGGEIVRRGHQVDVFAGNFQSLILLSIRGHEHGGEHEVVRVFRVQRQSFLSVFVALYRITLRIPVHCQIAIRECQRIFGDGLLH